MNNINNIYFITIIKVFVTGVVILALLGIVSIAFGIYEKTVVEQVNTYDFPLQREVVEQVVEEKQLTWFIEDEQSFIEGQSVFSLRDNENVFCSLNSYSGEKGRFIILQFHFPKDYSSKQIQQFNKEEWFNLFELACTFYGNNKDVKKVYKEFLAYLKGRNSIEYEYGYFTKRIDETHFKINLSLFKNNYYQLSTLKIMNSESYENIEISSSEGWINYSKSKGIKILDDISVTDIAEINTEDEIVRLIVQGHLKDVRKLKKVPETLQEVLTHHPHKDDYFTAKLVDETGSIDVYAITTSLNSSELRQNRNHHISYYPKEKLVVINFSTSNE